VFAFCGEFGKQLCVHGVGNSSPAARQAPIGDRYARRMDNEELAESSSGSAAVDATVEEDLLIEEISIDGMCGVY